MFMCFLFSGLFRPQLPILLKECVAEGSVRESVLSPRLLARMLATPSLVAFMWAVNFVQDSELSGVIRANHAKFE